MPIATTSLMRDDKGDNKEQREQKPTERQPTDHREARRAKFVTEDLENPFIWRGMD